MNDMALPQPSGEAPIWPLVKVAAEFSQQLVMVNSPSSPAAEGIRALRSYLMVHHVQLGRRSVSICASSEGVGCSFVAANLAVSLAQIGVKPLLIDGNLRKPGLDDFIRLPEKRGLAQSLES